MKHLNRTGIQLHSLPNNIAAIYVAVNGKVILSQFVFYWPNLYHLQVEPGIENVRNVLNVPKFHI